MAMKRLAAFTLVEMLAVMTIMAILMSMGFGAFRSAQRRSRDARRREDIQAIQTGFEQYFADNGSYESCANMTDAQYFLAGALPSDPLTGTAYTCFADAAGYCACATLEQAGGNSSADAVDTNCSFGSGEFYCLMNVQ